MSDALTQLQQDVLADMRKHPGEIVTAYEVHKRMGLWARGGIRHGLVELVSRGLIEFVGTAAGDGARQYRSGERADV